MILEISDNFIDTKEIALVTKLDPDPDWQSYDVVLKSGREIKVYEDCHKARNRNMRFYMKREDLLKAWMHEVIN